MSFAYGPIDNKESIATLNLALELGINFWDTADMYASGKNEELISGLLRSHRDKVFIATKFGFRLRDENAPFAGSGSSNVYIDGSPAYIKTAVEKSLRRLKIDTIDLYYAHRIDPNTPIEDTVGAMAGLIKEGKVRYLGLSEASATSLRRAHAVHPITALQSEYSLLSRDVESEILPVCRELSIALVPYSPLARGLVTNTVSKDGLATDDFRKTLPRFSDEHWDNNQKLAAAFPEVALHKDITPAQLALAWVLGQGDNIIPIPGTKKRKYLQENAGAVDIGLSAEDMQKIGSLLTEYPDTGKRYGEQSLKLVDL